MQLLLKSLVLMIYMQAKSPDSKIYYKKIRQLVTDIF